MDKLESFTKSEAPIFDGTNYTFWKVRMRVYLMAQGSKVWNSVVTDYSTTTNPPTNATGRKLVDNNAKNMNAILSELVQPEFMKVMQCASTKDMWDKLQTIYEGDGKVKDTKLWTYSTQFEGLKMEEDENVETYFLKMRL